MIQPFQPLPSSSPETGTLGWWLVIGCLALAVLRPGQIRADDAPVKSHSLRAASGSRTGFTLVSAELSGIRFTNRLSREFAAQNQIRMNGSGVAAGDVDGDGRPDLFFCGVEAPARLYRNLGNWKFEDVTEASGLDFTGRYTTGAALVDVDGDGDLDLLVNLHGGGTREFLNDGHGHFVEKLNSGLQSSGGAMSMALADIDGDGDLDLYVANYRTTTIRSTGFSVLRINGQRVIRPEDRDALEYTPAGAVLEHGEPDVLYRNDGRGNWTPVPWDQGAFLDESGAPIKQAPRDWGLSVAFRDLNGDGAPDLYVCNDFHSVDRVWINDGHGQFHAMATLALRSSPTFSMCVDFADVNRDGHDDFFVADMLDRAHTDRLVHSPGAMAAIGDYESLTNRPQNSRNVLQQSRGDNTYADVAYARGVATTGWTWSSVFLDVDLDGYEDLLLTTGNLVDTQDLDANARIDAGGPYRKEQIPGKLLQYGPRPGRHQLYHNLGGLGFEEVGVKWGFGMEGVGHGMCVVDVDGDGDLDVVVNEMNGVAGVYRNEAGGGRVAVRLKGEGKNTRGIGARVTLRGGAVGEQSQEMMAGGRYLSSDDAMRVFASGKVEKGMELEVRWRSGKRSVVKGVEANREYEIEESRTTERWESPKRGAPTPWFREVSTGVTHHEEGFEDFERQGLLPRKLSQLGPGVGWMDVDGDGLLDVVMGSGKNGKLSWLWNDGKGGFEAREGAFADRDQSGLAGLPGAGRKTGVVYGSANYEEYTNTEGGAELWQAGGEAEKVVKGPWGSSSAIAVADLKGNGELEVFVGCRVKAGRYPESEGSRIWKREGGVWKEDAVNTAALKDSGLVSGAVWSDLDGDGYPELVLATEWGAIRTYRNRKGELKEEEMGLGKYRGYWNGVSAGDFDGDGKMDLVASNWGRNTRHGRDRLYWGDWNTVGTVELLEAEEEGGKWQPVRDLNTVSKTLPWVREKYASHRAWAEAEMGGILAGRKSGMLEVDWLGTTVFLNRGGKFEAVELPEVAQRTVGYGVCVADYDGDGLEDVLVVGNFFGVNASESRSDAGRGAWLKGDGKGGFAGVEDSGLEVYGEGRGAAVGDYDGDGRVDVVVGQNGAGLKLYHNERAKRGLKVKVVGKGENRDGYGAVIRLEYADGKLGPAREVHGGSGYWSQDATEQVMGMQAEVKAVHVTWPGGTHTRTELPPNSSHCTLSTSGQLLH